MKTLSLMLPLTHSVSSSFGAPRPRLRQAAGRYVTYALLRWKIDRDILLILFTMQIINILKYTMKCVEGFELIITQLTVRHTEALRHGQATMFILKMLTQGLLCEII